MTGGWEYLGMGWMGDGRKEGRVVDGFLKCFHDKKKKREIIKTSLHHIGILFGNHAIQKL